MPPVSLRRAAELSGFDGVNIGTDVVPRDFVLDGLFDRNHILGWHQRVSKKPVPNVLLFHRLRHDCGESAGEFGLAASSLDGSFDGIHLGHGREGTQLPLCLQQPPLLGTIQRSLYIQGMTYGERLEKARLHRGLDQPTLAKRVKELMAAGGRETKISQQTISKAERGVSGSVYTSWFAKALGVSFDWLESEIGEMELMPDKEHSNWPFEFAEKRFLKLSPTNKKLIERTVLAMIEGFEAQAGDALPPKKTRKKHK